MLIFFEEELENIGVVHQFLLKPNVKFKVISGHSFKRGFESSV